MLNQVKSERGIGWDNLVIDTVCAQYGLDKSVMALPKKEAANVPAGRATGETAAELGQESKGESIQQKKSR